MDFCVPAPTAPQDHPVAWLTAAAIPPPPPLLGSRSVRRREAVKVGWQRISPAKRRGRDVLCQLAWTAQRRRATMPVKGERANTENPHPRRQGPCVRRRQLPAGKRRVTTLGCLPFHPCRRQLMVWLTPWHPFPSTVIRSGRRWLRVGCTRVGRSCSFPIAPAKAAIR